VSRHYLGISARGPTVFRNIRTDDTGEPLLLIDEGAVVILTVDFADWLETGETIEDVTATARSCAITVDFDTEEPSFTIAISAVTSNHDGDITLMVEASSSAVYRGIIRVRRTNRYTDEALVFGDYV
jgi:hypothetical protein